MVVGILAYPVNCILLSADVVGVPTNDVPVLADFIGHQLLVDPEVINFESTLSIGVIVVLQLLVKLKSGFLQFLNL
jgi:hypothetical protein